MFQDMVTDFFSDSKAVSAMIFAKVLTEEIIGKS